MADGGTGNFPLNFNVLEKVFCRKFSLKKYKIWDWKSSILGEFMDKLKFLNTLKFAAVCRKITTFCSQLIQRTTPLAAIITTLCFRTAAIMFPHTLLSSIRPVFHNMYGLHQFVFNKTFHAGLLDDKDELIGFNVKKSKVKVTLWQSVT